MFMCGMYSVTALFSTFFDYLQTILMTLWIFEGCSRLPCTFMVYTRGVHVVLLGSMFVVVAYYYNGVHLSLSLPQVLEQWYHTLQHARCLPKCTEELGRSVRHRKGCTIC